MFRKGKKAAPRFELGIKDLQSSALPLGHAATPIEKTLSSSADSISHLPKTVLVLCNGHGEDIIALRILEEIHALRPLLPLEVLPMVGKGKVFQKAISQGWLTNIGKQVNLPSGGFSNQSLKGLILDIASGLIKIIFEQWSTMFIKIL